MCSVLTGMRIVPGCARTLRWLLPAGLWLAAALCQAQEPGGAAAPLGEVVERVDQPAGEARPAGARPAIEADGDLFDIRYLEGPDGRPVFVPDKVRLDEFLNWLEQRKARAGDGPPGVSVSSLSLEGTADEER